MKNQYYIPLAIWKRLNNREMVCYNLFQRVSDRYYAVQSKDFYQIDSLHQLIKEFDEQRIVLFIDEDIETRASFFDTIERAIEDFEISFCEF